MSIIIDLIIIAIVAISILFGYKKGLAKCIIKVVAFFVAVIVAAMFYKPVSNLIIEKTQIDESIKSSIVNIIKDDVEEEGKVKEDTNLPETIVDSINKSVEKAVKETKQNAVEVAADGIAITTIRVGTAILLFVVVRILLMVVSALSSIITDLPIIKQFDKAGGIAYGLLKSIVIIFIIFAVISLISPLIEGTGIIVAINKSFVGSILYNNNILLKIIFK